MNKHVVRTGAALMASALLLFAPAAGAQEKKLGDYVYVPAMSTLQQTGRISLRVQALSLSQDSDAPGMIDSLAGCEFGVYVRSGSGEMVRWANPLYPSEAMVVRTGEEAVCFTLPEDMEFYLIQESAPAGYAFDREPIPVTGEEIVVSNAMSGEVLVSVVDSLGTPLEGVELTVVTEDGASQTQTVDGSHAFALPADRTGTQTLTIRESALPESVYPALSATVDGQVQEAGELTVQVQPATRTRVVFEHPASGTVQLRMRLTGIDDYGEETNVPLAGVRMEIEREGGEPLSIVTDEEGFAQASLLEGSYLVRFSYEGDCGAVLPIEIGQMIVESGSSTMIDLAAMEPTGRIAVQAQTAERIQGGSVTLQNEWTGESFGPFAFNADGEAVSCALTPGEYRVSAFELPENMELGTLSCAGEESRQTDGLLLKVDAGAATRVTAELLTRERGTFEVVAQRIDERGEAEQTRLEAPLELELIDEQGAVAADVDALDGYAQIEALSGTYVLRMDGQTANSLGVQAVSLPFELPAMDEAVVFCDSRTRLILSSVGVDGTPVSGAVYNVTDSTGSSMQVVCDESGEAVTPLLAAGEVRVETLTAPQSCDVAPVYSVNAAAGEALRVQIVHERYGEVRLTVRKKSLDDRGGEIFAAMPGVHVRLYRVEGQSMTELGVMLAADADGSVRTALPAGEYIAQLDADSLPENCRAGEALRFATENETMTEGELTASDVLGGIRVRMTGSDLSDELLAQIRFELADTSGAVTDLTMQDGAFYAGALPAGTYLLRQTQLPAGYTLAADRTVSITGAEVAAVEVPLEEYAEVTVLKTGLTFSDSLQAYIVPLTGQYGVYTMEDVQMKPYPTEGAQATLWSNVTPEQIEQGKAAKLKLPASLEGTTYYFKELGAAQGFAADEEYHELRLVAGQQAKLECAVSSDRGFFELEQRDADSGELVAGGEYALIDGESGETVLTFAPDGKAYRNAMAVPVGTYTLRQMEAAQGYALSETAEQTVVIEPYLTQGGYVTPVSFSCARIPQSQELEAIEDLYAAREQGLTLVSVDLAQLEPGDTLTTPQVSVRVASQTGARVNVANVVLGAAGDAQGGEYLARVEYCLAGGGWQPSDARMTGVLSAPTAVNLADVADDVCAIRVTYLNAQTGEEIAGNGFAPGQVTLNVRAGVSETVALRAEASFEGKLIYRTAFGGREETILRTDAREIAFDAVGDGAFGTVSAGRDGRITGTVFFDENADGVMNASEKSRYAGLTVQLLSQSGDVVESCRTDAQGTYRFTSLASGVYTVRFDAGESVVFSSSSRFSAHQVSGIVDSRFGMSAPLTIDGDHTDYVVHAGCLYAAAVEGRIFERTESDLEGMGGVGVEIRAVGADADEEPVVILTDDAGGFRAASLLPGTYEVSIEVPSGFLFEEAEDGMILSTVNLSQGDTFLLGGEAGLVGERAGSIAGAVRVDDDGDGVIASGAQTLPGVKVVLLRAQDGHTEPVAETITDAQGEYAFDSLYAGKYSVLFELGGEWTFTRHGADSCVYGAVSQSGGSRVFDLAPGEQKQGLDAGVTLPAQLTVTVFMDTHVDGQKSTYEEGLEGVSISLIRLEDGEEAESVTYRTGEDGSIVFAGVSPGEYVLSYQMPGLWRATKNVDAATTSYPVSCVPQSALSTGSSEPFALTMGQTGMHLYIGAMLSGSIGGIVYDDSDDDAARSETEEACEGVLVELLDVQGTVIEETQTEADGSYIFEGLAPGRYFVRFTAQGECGFSATERTMMRGGVQRSDTSVGMSRSITVSAGTSVSTADAGVVRLSDVSGKIWVDADNDGVIAENENGLAGVSVQLMNGTGRTILSTAQTNDQGGFSFAGLRPGSYMLRVDAPQDYVFSGAMQGGALPLDSARDGHGYSASFELLGGVHVDQIGYGLLTQGTVSGVIWTDADYDGWLGEEESGLRGATVELCLTDGTPVAQMQTARTGAFSFGGVMPGEYDLTVTLPEGYVYTAEGGDSAAMHSDSLSQRIELGEMTMGGAMTDIRVGALMSSSVGGVVWYDADDDGRRQTTSEGLSGVRVTLSMLSGNDAGRTMETFTGVDGAYRFDGVMPGDAALTFTLENGLAFARSAAGTRRVSIVPQTDALSATSGAIAVISGENQLELDCGAVGVGVVSGTVWEDSEYDGRRSTSERGVAGAQAALIDALSGEVLRTAVTDETGAYAIDFVRMGEYQVRIALPDGRIFTKDGESAVAQSDSSEGLTQRFALAMGESVSGLDAGAITPAVIEGQLRVDANLDGACGEDEEGLADAVVTLMQGGTVVATASTDKAGAFRLDTLRPGSYRVRMSLPSRALFAQGVALRLADPDAQEGETGEMTLAMGEKVTLDAIPAVIGSTVSGRAWSDENADGRMDANEPALTGVMAELLLEGRTIDSAEVGEDGSYAFRLLRNGRYAVRFTLPEGMLLADQSAGDSGVSSVPVVPGNAGTTDEFELAMGETRKDVNVGGIRPGEIGDSVWLDENANGLQDYREPLLAGVSVTLLRAAEGSALQEIATTVSDEYGYYRFADLRPGNYVLRVDAQGGTLTERFGAPLGEIDSDADPATGETEVINLQSGQTCLNVDFGFTAYGTGH